MLTILRKEDAARRHLTTSQDGPRAASSRWTTSRARPSAPAWRITEEEGTVLASDHIGVPADGDSPLERQDDQVRAGMLPVQVWQPRTKEFQLQALTHWRAGFPPFPEAYRLPRHPRRAGARGGLRDLPALYPRGLAA